MYAIYGVQASGVTIDRLGGLGVYRGIIPPSQPDPLRESMIRDRFLETLNGGREVLAQLGAHGDLRLAYELQLGVRDVLFDIVPGGGVKSIPRTLRVERWTSFNDDTVGESVFAEIRRAVGIGPRAPE